MFSPGNKKPAEAGIRKFGPVFAGTGSRFLLFPNSRKNRILFIPPTAQGIKMTPEKAGGHVPVRPMPAPKPPSK